MFLASEVLCCLPEWFSFMSQNENLQDPLQISITALQDKLEIFDACHDPSRNLFPTKAKQEEEATTIIPPRRKRLGLVLLTKDVNTLYVGDLLSSNYQASGDNSQFSSVWWPTCISHPVILCWFPNENSMFRTRWSGMVRREETVIHFLSTRLVIKRSPPSPTVLILVI